MPDNDVFEKMTNSDALFRAAMEQSGEGISLTDTEGRFVYVNDAFSMLFGYSRTMLEGMSAGDLLPRGTRVSGFIATEKKQCGTREMELMKKDGSRFWAEIRDYPISFGNRNLFLGIVHDISKLKHTEHALRESEKKYRSLFKNMLNGYAYCRMIYDGDKPVDFIYLDVNSAFEKLTGLKDVIGKNVSEVIPGLTEMDRDVIEIFGRVAGNGIPETFEYYLESLSMWFSVAVYSPEKGCFVVIFDVITERKQAEIERETTIRLLEILNTKSDLRELMKSLLKFMRNLAGCEAVGIRLKEGEDFPYFVTCGFSDDFVAGERFLCARDMNGQLIRDFQGNPVLECMCGNVICGRFDPSLPFFTEFGSFISNGTTQLLASTTEEDRQARTRNRCNGEGFESVFLVPLRTGGETFGLIQFNDYKKNRFSKRFIAQAENLAGNIAIALAQRNAVASLHESEEKYRVLFNTFPLGIIMSDEGGHIVEANNKSAELLGIPKDEHQARDIDGPEWHLIRPDGSDMPRDEWPSIRALNDNRLIENSEMGVVKPGGDITWLSVTAAPIPLENYGVVVTYGDITARKQAEKDYQTLFREMLEGFALHEIICNSDGLPVDYRFLAVNPAFENMTGQKAESIVGRTVLEVFPDIERFWIETYGKVALTGEPAFFENYTAHLDKYFQITAFRPAPGQFASVFVDITDRKIIEAEREKLRNQLHQAQRLEAIGNLAGGIAHDFNNILFPIMGISEMLLEDLPPGSPEFESAEEIFKAGKRGSDLVKQILAFSRQSDQQKTPVRVQNVLNEVLKLSRATIPSNIEIRHDIQPDCGMIMTDGTRIHQVAMNIITNAYHALEEKGGCISVKLRERVLDTGDLSDPGLEPGKYAVLSISDNGTGMSPDVIENIFDPYFTTKVQGKGTGLGLSVVHGIVKENQGSIRVHSQLGQGTTFHIYLPLMEKTGEALPVELQEPSPAGHEHILLVDDEVAIAKLEEVMLARLGYTITSCTGSYEALEAFKARPDDFDLLITDMTMPDLSGDELAKAVLAVRPDIPIIICTGFSERLDDEKAHSIGVKGFLMKPIVKNQLAQMVRDVLDDASVKV